jgi:deoxyribose-phosphate aldolase
MSEAGRLRQVAHRLLPMLDLSGVGIDADERSVRALCRAAQTPAGNVAAVCVSGEFVSISKQTLLQKGIGLSAMIASPDEARAAIAAGADEIELSLTEGAIVAAVRAAIGRKPLLKVALETGRLTGPAAIRAAAEAAIAAGADFLATSSTGSEPGASPEAAAVILGVIAAARRERRWIGFKAAGGIRALGDAQSYLALYDRIMGEGAASAAGFRIGAGSLLNNLLMALGLGSSIEETSQ